MTKGPSSEAVATGGCGLFGEAFGVEGFGEEAFGAGFNGFLDVVT